MNAKQIRESIDESWPVEARFLIEKAATLLAQSEASLKAITEHNLTNLLVLDEFEKKPWWRKTFRRSATMKLLKESIQVLLKNSP